MAFGSVPGGQDSYRAEATAILFALLSTKGNCIMTVDNESVYRMFKKPPNSDTKFNGLLWHAMFTAKTARLQEGRGSIELK